MRVVIRFRAEPDPVAHVRRNATSLLDQRYINVSHGDKVAPGLMPLCDVPTDQRDHFAQDALSRRVYPPGAFVQRRRPVAKARRFGTSFDTRCRSEGESNLVVRRSRRKAPGGVHEPVIAPSPVRTHLDGRRANRPRALSGWSLVGLQSKISRLRNPIDASGQLRQSE